MIAFDAERDAPALDRLAAARELELGEARAPLARFAALVSRWGQRTDLVAGPSVEALVEVLFLDAFALSPLVPEGAELIDVGAGAGAPTIPLALLRPDLRAELREPRRRRVAFMRTAVGALGLAERVRVREGRLADGEEGSFEVALSRATFAPEEWLRRGSALARRGILLLAREAPPERPGWAPIGEVRYAVPSSGAPRRAVAYEAR